MLMTIDNVERGLQKLMLVFDNEDDHDWRFRRPVIDNNKVNLNLSTTSAMVIWKNPSLSNFFKTDDLISANCMDSNKVSKALEYEFTAMFNEMAW
ncbi:hypothetical protein FOB22_006903 [Saccharomyces cerevisiae]|nr:hypothetical protein FOB22_006903 [Saccharomyces cerevisiae]